MKIKINNKIYKAIKKNNIYSYKDDDFTVTINTDKNTIIRRNEEYYLNLKLDLNNTTENVCNYNGNEFILLLETIKIIKTEFSYEVKYKITGGEIICFKLEEIND